MPDRFDEPGLFAAPGVRKHRHELHADAVVRDLRAAGKLEGRHALAASSLRAAARAVDAAEQAVASQPTPYAAIALAQTTRALLEVLTAYGLTIGAGGDLDDF